MATPQTNRLAKSSPQVVYMGPEKGPFKCGHCEYFQSPSQCQKVAGMIDANGCCNLYQMGSGSGTLASLRKASA